jgi:hypothetical protein
LRKIEDPEIVIANFDEYLRKQNSSPANTTACKTALSVLFRAIGFKNEQINGLIVH